MYSEAVSPPSGFSLKITLAKLLLRTRRDAQTEVGEVEVAVEVEVGAEPEVAEVNDEPSGDNETAAERVIAEVEGGVGR